MICNNKPIDNYNKINSSEWKKFSGHLSTSAQPGHGKNATQDKMILDLLISNKEENLFLAEDIISDLLFLNEQKIDIIYSLAHIQTDRNPQLIQYLWQKEFNKDSYITHINNISIAIEDFHAPSSKQLNIISDDIIDHLLQGKNILVHCAAGRGRTGTIVAATYMKAFQETDVMQAINYVRSYIPGAIETKEQTHALELFADTI